MMESRMKEGVEKRKIISSSNLIPIKLDGKVCVEDCRVKELDNQIARISISGKSSNVANPINSIKEESDHNSTRFNPFDQIDCNSEQSSSTSVESESTTNDDAIDASLAQLGLAEDHFSYNQGHLGLSSVEEVTTAIENCKDMIMKLPESSKKRKKLVGNLVALRIELQDIKDKANTDGLHITTILGHTFRRRKNRSVKNHCDCCSSAIWGMMQAWYQCKNCGYVCHEKCMNSIHRMCVGNTADSLSFELSICPEVGLSKQQYSCAECKNAITIGGGDDIALLCDYTGLYYCSNCHWNDVMVIPARVLHNWDHTPHKVCRHSYQILNKMKRRPILHIEQINPKLFNYVEELSEIRRMREDIMKMKQYFLTCADALEAKLLRKLEERQHFVDNSYMYSMKDLIETNLGLLTDSVANIHVIYAKHIKLDCLVCQAKGFICEICNSGESLFPFDFMVSSCPNCSAVFHGDCFSFMDKMCPRCKRKEEKRRIITSEEDFNSDSNDVETNLDQVAQLISPFTSWMSSHRHDNNKSVHGEDDIDLTNENKNFTKPTQQDVGNLDYLTIVGNEDRRQLSKQDVDEYNEQDDVETYSITEKMKQNYTTNQFGYQMENDHPNEEKDLHLNNQEGEIESDNLGNPFLSVNSYDDTKNPFTEDEVTTNPFLQEDLLGDKNPFCC